MAFTNTDLGLDWGTSGGGSAATDTSLSSGNSWTDRLFGFGKDVFSGYLDLKSEQLLINEQTKLALAQQQQQQMLGFVEQPTNVGGQTLEPWQVAALSQGQQSANNQKLILFGLVGLGLYLAFK